MKQFYGIAVAAMFLGAATLPASAVKAVEVAAGAALQQTGIGMHQPEGEASTLQPVAVAGTVTEIDHSRGLLTLSSTQGTQKLYFPPQSIATLKKGDRITAQFAFAKTGIPPASTRAYDVPKDLVQHRTTGTVTEVDHQRGWVHVKTDAAMLELHFPAQAVSDLREGDRITLDMGYSKGL